MSVQTKIAAAKAQADLKNAETNRRQQEASEKFGKAGKGGIISNMILPVVKAAASKFINHPEWYKKFGDIEQFANIPTFLLRTMSPKGSIYGVTTILSNQYRPNGRNPDADMSLPSVLVHNFLPTLAYRDRNLGSGTPSFDGESFSINQTIKMVLTEIGKVNSRAVDPDVSIGGLYFLGVTDLHSCLAEIKFMCDVIDQFSETDPAIPEALIKAKGWDFRFIKTHYAELRRIYDIYARRISTVLPIPKDFSLLERRLWLNGVVIQDADTPKPVYQVFKQVSFGRVTLDGLLYNYWNYISDDEQYDIRMQCANEDNFVPLTQWLDHAIQGITDDQDYCTFIANLRAACDASAFYIAPTLDQNVVHINFMDDNIRQQMMNIVTLPRTTFLSTYNNFGEMYTRVYQWININYDSNGDLFQSTQYELNTYTSMVEAKQYCSGVAACMLSIGVFNSFKKSVTVDDILSMTRLHPEYYVKLNEVDKDVVADAVFISRGTEVIMNSYLLYYDKDEQRLLPLTITTDLGVNEKDDNGYYVSAVDTGSIYNTVLSIDGIYNVYFLASTINMGAPRAVSLQQWDNVFTIPPKNLADLHYLCGRSEYYFNPALFKTFRR